MLRTELNTLLGIDFPVIMAPMFLVSNEEMITAAMKNGIAGAFPSLNYRKAGELESILTNLNRIKAVSKSGSYGVNLIVQQTNPLYEKHLEICKNFKVPFYITSLGDPTKVIETAHAYGAKVFCDVTNLKHAEKVAKAGCDGFIAVGKGAGGHAGPTSLQELIPELKKHFPNVPVIAAGGIANGSSLTSALDLGACGASIGTRFIASHEAKVSDAYKQAIVNSTADDIVLTDKLSGTPCTIINTPYAQKIGLKQNWFQRWLSRNKRTKKWFKTLIQFRGMKKLERAVQPGNYSNLWCAGVSVEQIHSIDSCAEIITRLKKEVEEILSKNEKKFS